MAFKLKTYVRVKEYLESPAKCIDVNEEGSTVAIKDVHNRFPSVSFSFPRVFTDESQETIYSSICPETTLSDVLKGRNAGFISYGQSRAGKAFTTFGDFKGEGLLSPKKGLAPRAVLDLLKIMAAEGVNYEVYASLIEVYVDQIRDLAVLFVEEQKRQKKYEELKSPGHIHSLLRKMGSKGLEIFDMGNGDTEIKEVSKIRVKAEGDVVAVIQSGFDLRKVLEKSNPSLSKRAHTVLIIRVEEPLSGKVVGKVYFAVLAGSERYGKGPGDSEKYREAMCISTDLKSLERAFLALPNEGVLPKETALISAIKGMLRQDSSATLIGHVVATNFEESLNTLQYVERCKAEVVGADRTNNIDSLGASGSDQLLRNLKQINEEYKREIEQTERRHEAQFERIKNVLALDMDLKTMMQRGPTQKDKTALENHRQAAERVKNFTERNKEMEYKLGKTKGTVERIKQKIEEKLQYFGKLLSGLNQELAKLTAESKKLKGEYNSLPSEMAYNIEEERKRLAEEKQQDLEEKLDILFSSQGVLDQHNEVMVEATRTFENAKKDIENAYRTQMRDYKKSQESSLINLAKQYQYYLGKKKEELTRFMEEAEKYCKKKKEYKKQMEDEVRRLSVIVQRQADIIRKAEEGFYTEGIKSINIKKNEKPILQYKRMAAELMKKTKSALTFDRPGTTQIMKRSYVVNRPQTKQLALRTIKYK